jgi:NADH-quinone oxidoreductase subunit M
MASWRASEAAVSAWFIRWLGVVGAILVVLAAATAWADPSGGRIALTLPAGGQGPLVLRPGEGGMVGQFRIGNVGSEPLTVSRIAIRGDEDDIRSPSRLSVRFVDGAATNATIAPGASKDAIVSWMPDRDPRVRQAFGHVVATSTDERSGEVAMGFRAQLPTGLGRIGEHALALLVLGPLLVIVLVAAARMAGLRDDPRIGLLCVAVGALELLLALWCYRRFASDVARADGNDGFQLVERAVWVRSIGSEWYVGVDGASIAFVLLAAVVAFVALLIASVERRGGAYYATLALLSTGVMGVLVALDLVLLFAAWQVVWLALVLLVGGWGGRRSALAASRIAVAGVVGSIALLLAFVALSRASGPTFLVDGAAIAHTLAVPELSRTAFSASSPICGLPFVGVTSVLLFAGIAILSPVVPFHRWLPDALEHGPASAGILLGGVVVTLGPYLLLRVGLSALPEGARWGAAAVAVLGSFGAGWGALCAMAQRDLRRFVAYTTIAASGLSLYGIGSLTAEGITAAMMALFAHGLSAALLLGVASAIEQRVHTSDAQRLGALVVDAPALRLFAAVGLGVSLGAPGLVGWWGILLAFLGGFARYPALTVVLAAAVVASAAAHIRIGRLLLMGEVHRSWRDSTYLKPFGGVLPDATSADLIALAPLAAIAAVLGLWPSPILAPMAVSARDSSALADLEGSDARTQ